METLRTYWGYLYQLYLTITPEVFWTAVLVLSLLAFIINSFRESKGETSKVATGFILWQAIDNWIDLIVYPFMLAWLGVTYGFIVMFFATLIGNTFYIIINNRTEHDWTLMSHFTNLKWIKRIMEWQVGSIKPGKALLFIIITIKFDSFWALNFLYGKQADLRKPKVLLTFLASHAICNFAWTFLVELVFIPLRFLLKLVHVA